MEDIIVLLWIAGITEIIVQSGYGSVLLVDMFLQIDHNICALNSFLESKIVLPGHKRKPLWLVDLKKCIHIRKFTFIWLLNGFYQRKRSVLLHLCFNQIGTTVDQYSSILPWTRCYNRQGIYLKLQPTNDYRSFTYHVPKKPTNYH